jgi:hypothetical protein
MKSARASRIELIDTIVDELRPWTEANSAETVRDAVTERLDVLGDVVPNHFSREAIRRTRQGARALRDAIRQLEESLARAPPELRMRLKLEPAPGWQHPLLQELHRARNGCESAVDAAPSTDKVKEWCARVAFQLILKFSETKPTGTDESPFRVIAALVYEAITGEPDRDLKRACDNHLREIRNALAAHAKVQIND